MAKFALGLSGVGNKIPHQLIISDLVFGVRKNLAKKKLVTTYLAIPEITLSELGVDVSKLKKNYNIDFVIYNLKTKKVELILEVERAEKSLTTINNKINDCFKNIPSIKEAFIVQFNNDGKVIFNKKTKLNKNKIIEKSTSNSTVLNFNLTSILIYGKLHIQ